ncbi:hypothetical protein D5086_006814 [Populus alba]|uniref:Uncharacterized protein n=1 Tax=Populus alba TaxID=43335 RepID=A0ACC4CN25_POPAL
MNDTVDKLVIFLAKRDGIDKLVKTFQYVSKLVRWQVEATHPDVAQRFKQWEVASGLGRKAFRTGRFLTGFNALRRGPGSTPTFKILAVLANAGEMVYFFFDHFLWLSRIGTLDAKLAGRMSFISAFGESFGYIFFIIADFIIIKEGLEEERRLLTSSKEDTSKDATESVRKIRADRVMRLMAVAANAADFIIALADIEPNPFCNHAVTLGVSGLVSAWAGWYRNWPSFTMKLSQVAVQIHSSHSLQNGKVFLNVVAMEILEVCKCNECGQPLPENFQPPADEPWTTGIFGCSEDTESCWTGLFCPCVLFGRNIESLRDDTPWTTPCVCHAVCIEGGITLAAATAVFHGIDPSTSFLICEGLLFAWWMCGIYTGLVRQSLQKKYHLKNSPCDPCMVHCCMHWCALCQEHREMKGRLSDNFVMPMTIVNPPPVQEMSATTENQDSAPSSEKNTSLEMQPL